MVFLLRSVLFFFVVPRESVESYFNITISARFKWNISICLINELGQLVSNEGDARFFSFSSIFIRVFSRETKADSSCKDNEPRCVTRNKCNAKCIEVHTRFFRSVQRLERREKRTQSSKVSDERKTRGRKCTEYRTRNALSLDANLLACLIALRRYAKMHRWDRNTVLEYRALTHDRKYQLLEVDKLSTVDRVKFHRYSILLLSVGSMTIQTLPVL